MSRRNNRRTFTNNAPAPGQQSGYSNNFVSSGTQGGGGAAPAQNYVSKLFCVYIIE